MIYIGSTVVNGIHCNRELAIIVVRKKQFRVAQVTGQNIQA